MGAFQAHQVAGQRSVELVCLGKGGSEGPGDEQIVP